MEYTQRLEYTQELYAAPTERICPEQIGFLGICGAKHPILRGPNKIGRDPQTCSIVLNLNSVSRQHAVINILNSKDFMLMDLGSANKTKHLNNTLQPYIPYPMKNGDTVQFGDIFGIFRLLEEDDDLPMTQAIDIPETPLPSKHVSKMSKLPTTMIPESPDVSSDKDDTFVTPTQQKNDRTRLSSGQFINPFGQTIPIHAISTKKDISPKSCKRSVSNPNSSLSELPKSNNNFIKNINGQSSSPVANTSTNVSTDSIYVADTQIPPGHGPLPTIYTLDTQMPAEHVPHVHKITDQQETQFDIYAANKENELSIFNADTQAFVCNNDEGTENENKVPSNNVKFDTNLKLQQKVNKPDEVLLFDEIEDEYMEDFNSQPLLPQESPKHDNKSSTNSPKGKNTFKSNNSNNCDDFDIMPTQKLEEISDQNNLTKIRGSSIDNKFMPTQKISEPAFKDNMTEKENSEKNAAQRIIRISSDSSTDCEDIDIIPTQKIPELKKEDDSTDCEDDFIELNAKVSKESVKNVELEEAVDFEDMLTQVIDIDPDKIVKSAVESINRNASTSNNDVSFEDQATQIIAQSNPNNSKALKVCHSVSPFKVPLVSPIRIKSKENTDVESKNDKNIDETVDLENYYNATQDILNDLCTQRDGSPTLNRSKVIKSPVTIDKDVVRCSVKNYVIKGKFPNIDKDLSPTTASENQKLKKYISSLSVEDVRDVIGVTVVDNLKKNSNDTSSDNETTPKKVTCIFTDSDLPNSQEIETSRSVALHMKDDNNEILSDSEPEENNKEQHTPLLNRKKKLKVVAKIDLTKKFDIENLPERIITRVRKPTAKLENNLQNCKKTTSNILRTKFLTEQEDEINEEIINENVKRLKTYERTKATKENKIVNTEKEESTKICDSKIESKEDVNTENPVRTKSAQSKNEKIKVKIVKPKRTETDTKSISKESASVRTKKEESFLKTNEKSIVTQRKAVAEQEKDNDKNKSKEAKSRSKSDEISKNGKNKSKNSNFHSKSDEQIGTRSRRSRKKEKDTEENKSESADNKKGPPESKRKGSDKKTELSDVEIRRSKRQANVKEKKSDSQTMKPPKSIQNKNDHEQSTVYNISSSGGESPRTLKRSLGDDISVPSPKRTRAFMNSENNISNSSLRATPARTMKTQYVLFTAFPSEEVKQKLEKLGAQVVTDVMKCTVVLTMQIKRTFKLLCAVGLGRPIVGTSWVQACVDTRMIVDPWLYLVKDEQAEKRFQFNLDKSLNGKREFLKGYNISSTPSVQPNGSEMKLIVECSGGIWKEGGPNWICVSCIKDQTLWPAIRKRGATIVSTEFILGGVLKQKLDITSNKFT